MPIKLAHTLALVGALFCHMSANDLASAQGGPEPAKAASQAGATAGGAAPRIEKIVGVWVEGPGYDVSYGGVYDTCAQRCLAAPRCVMIEYYRPEKKCNLYDAVRPRLKGGSSFVGIKTATK